MYDGASLIQEYCGGSMAAAYVHGARIDEPLVEYVGGQRRHLMSDDRGSVIAPADDSGNVLGVNRYDEYGVPSSSNSGRFQYNGQPWLGEIGMYYSRARMYDPVRGRFPQPDPIGYGDGANRYAYVSGDPVNRVDPSGMWGQCIYERRFAFLQKTAEDGDKEAKIIVLDRWTEVSTCGDSQTPGLNLGALLRPIGELREAVGICFAPPGTQYRSVEEAGRDATRAAEWHRLNSGELRREWGGRLVRISGGYTYTPPVQGPLVRQRDGLDARVRFQGRSSDAGWYHVHSEGAGRILSDDDRQMVANFFHLGNRGLMTFLGADGPGGQRIISSWRGLNGVNSTGTPEGSLTC